MISSNFIFNFTNFYVTVSYFWLTLGILFSVVRAAKVVVVVVVAVAVVVVAVVVVVVVVVVIVVVVYSP